MHIAFVHSQGEHRESFFPDTLLAMICADARAAGHDAHIVHAFYDGSDRARDAEVSSRIRRWLDERQADLVVVDRVIDGEAFGGRDVLMVSRGESFEPLDAVRWVIGQVPGHRRGVQMRRTPSVGELLHAARGVLARMARGEPIDGAPGVLAMQGDRMVGVDGDGSAAIRPYRPVLEHDTIALDTPPPERRKTLFGNTGCPYGDDPLKTPHHRGLTLANDGSIARLGCAFCHMGGDYQKRPDDEVVADLIEQASVLTRAVASVEELVLADQHAMRYLAALMDAAGAAGLRPVRWLFAARADAFVRERSRIEDAIAAAARAGQRLEVYLSGFEAFSDRELERYNKGTTVEEMLGAVAAMRELKRAHPDAFDYARARGHSLILWNPWTAPEDLAETAANVRSHGLAELFHELGRNRLRLYGDLPIHAAAERDGALLDAWEHGDRGGSGRAKGYNPERPWRFLDPRTSLAHRLAERLRADLGAETEVTQLTAIAELTSRARVSTPAEIEATVETCLRGLADLRASLDALAARDRPSGGPVRGTTETAAVVHFTGACNNGCASCANRDRWLDDATPALLARIEAARATSTSAPICLAGREPTLHPAFLELVHHARTAGAADTRRVAIVTNGRRFAYPGFTREAHHAGLTAASVKLFAPDAALADAIARVDGAHVQALAGLRALRATGVAALEIRAPLHRTTLASFADHAAAAASAQVRQLRIEAALDAIGLDQLSAAAEAVTALARACTEHDVALDASPLTAAARHFTRIPAPPVHSA